MALQDVLASIPGRGAYLAQQQFDQQQGAGQLAQLLGAMSMVEQTKQRQLQQQMQEAQLAEFQRKAQEEQALSSRLPELTQQYLSGETPNYRGFAGALMSTRGGLQPGMKFLEAAETRDLRQAEGQANRAAQMERLALQMGMQDQWRQMEDSRKRELATMIEQGKLDRASFAAALRESGGSRLEPFKFSMGGQNMQGWRDRYGNVYDANRRAIPGGYQPEISSADQTAEQKRVSEQETLTNANDMLNRIQQINAANPALTSGVAAPAANAVTWLYNQTLGHVAGYGRAPNEQATQLRDMVISSIGGLSRLSNQDRERIENAWRLGLGGNPKGVEDAIALTRSLVNAKYAGSASPVGRITPGGQQQPQQPNVIDFSQLPRGR